MNYCGIDIGSTTVKYVLLDETSQLLDTSYQRHNSTPWAVLRQLISDMPEQFRTQPVAISFTGSGALRLHEVLGAHFTQEVMASTLAVRWYDQITRATQPTDTIIELGGEDSKRIFLDANGGTDPHMNDTCAAGTGAAIDRFAELLGAGDATGLDQLAARATGSVGIARRCSVFAQNDIQNHLNMQRDPADIAAGVYLSVAKQNIMNHLGGRAGQCRRVALLGGPLSFSKQLQNAFAIAFRDEGSEAELYCPEHSEFFVAIGAALSAQQSQLESTSFAHFLDSLATLSQSDTTLPHRPPLFTSAEQYQQFKETHHTNIRLVPATRGTPKYLGVDFGSTTVKAVIADADGRIVWSFYEPNNGRSVRARIEQIEQHITPFKDDIVYSVATGYGGNAALDAGLADSTVVETMAHLAAARYVTAGAVSFILDIGGQDVKAIWVRNGAIVNVVLNEACSSGCGSFLEIFAKSVGLTVQEFNQEALKSTQPLDLGARCTVFMGSSVKDAQSKNAKLPDILAGLAHSVVENALTKVIGISSLGSLGEHIVVQGGTFLHDSVLRAFEQSTGRTVTRPEIAGLMGAYGAALIAGQRAQNPKLIPKPAAAKTWQVNTVQATREYLERRTSAKIPLATNRPQSLRIGIPMVLNLYENYVFWHALFSALGFSVVPSDISSRTTYENGAVNYSENLCFPAKLIPPHFHNLMEKGVRYIWAPLIQSEIRESPQDNYYNCPVVTGGFAAAAANMPAIRQHGVTVYTAPVPYDRPSALLKHLYQLDILTGIPARHIKAALQIAQHEDCEYKDFLSAIGDYQLDHLKADQRLGFVLLGHPYHADPILGGFVADAVTKLGVGVLTAQSISHLIIPHTAINVNNQWKYHDRLYRAARYAVTQPNLEVIHIVSFGCGIDSLVSMELRRIVEGAGRIYTQLKLDEMVAAHTIDVRLRTLIAAHEERAAH